MPNLSQGSILVSGRFGKSSQAAAHRLGDAREDLEQGGLPRAVAAKACPEWQRRDADDLPALHLEGDVAQGPEERVVSFQFTVISARV